MGPPKSEAGKRTLAIPAYILPALRMHLESYAEAGAKGRVFVGAKGRDDAPGLPAPGSAGRLEKPSTKVLTDRRSDSCPTPLDGLHRGFS